MFRQTWKKYLPVISILLKRSATSDQQLNMNHTDFERAAGGRKIKFSFSHFDLQNGKMNNPAKQSPLAKDLVTMLQEDAVISRMISDQQLEFTMNNEFQLLIKNNTSLATAGTEAEEEVALSTDIAENAGTET